MSEQEKKEALPDGHPDTDSLRISRKKKKKKSHWISNIILLLLLLVMGYSAYQIISQYRNYAEAGNEYKEIESGAVAVMESDPFTYAYEDLYPAAVPSKTDPTQPLEPAETRPQETGDEQPQTTDIETEAAIETTEAPSLSPEMQIVLNAPKLAPLSIDYAELSKMNSHFRGWLQGQESRVSLPVVQASDNSYYLKHTFYRTDNGSGTLFVDYRNDFLNDDMTFIYGHHMKNGSMFGSLDDYDSYAYWEQHPYFRLYTEEAVYELRVFAVIYTNGAEKITFNFGGEEGFMAAVDNYIKRSKIKTEVTVKPGDKLVGLCTCAYHVDNGRYLLVCKVVRIG